MTIILSKSSKDYTPKSNKPCPFCGGSELKVINRGYIAHVKCESCGAHGPEYLREENAITAWNNRAGQEAA